MWSSDGSKDCLRIFGETLWRGNHSTAHWDSRMVSRRAGQCDLHLGKRVSNMSIYCLGTPLCSQNSVVFVGWASWRPKNVLLLFPKCLMKSQDSIPKQTSPEVRNPQVFKGELNPQGWDLFVLRSPKRNGTQCPRRLCALCCRRGIGSLCLMGIRPSC